jgi:hypothetical protein
MSELLWVAVPGGTIREDGAVLRALVVPRLSGLPDDSPLSSYGLADWPMLLNDATLAVEVAASPDSTATVLDDAVRLDGQHVRPALWAKVFDPGLRVRPFQPPMPYNVPNVDATSDHANVLRRVYAEASLPSSRPGAESLADADLGDTTAVPHLSGEDEQVVPPRQAPDFHRVVTMLREHPPVLRALGLLVEFRLPEIASLGAEGVVRVTCRLSDVAPEVTCVSPWTRHVVSTNRFLPASPPQSDIIGGVIDLRSTFPDGHPAAGQGKWQLETFDVTGAVERARETTASMRRARDRADVSAGRQGIEPRALPAVRSAGLSLLRRGRSEVFRVRADRAAGNIMRRSLDGEVLDADDLVLGYRVDVRLADGDWRSLMQRRAAYFTKDEDVLVESQVEEGQVKPHAVTVVDQGGLDTRDVLPRNGRDGRILRADEVVTRWDGWSLTCPRPAVHAPIPSGKQLDHVRWVHSPLGLPTLRFGEQYRMRIRIADAAGGGLGLGDPETSEGESDEIFYGRHDPVRPPFMVPPPQSTEPVAQPPPEGQSHSPMGPGGSVDVLVIRSDPINGRGVDAFTASFVTNDRRTLLPPPASFSLVEQHGMFDGQTDETSITWLRRSLEPESVTNEGTYSWLPDPVAERMVISVREGAGMVAAGESIREAWRLPEGEWPDFRPKTLRLEPRSSDAQKRLEWVESFSTAVVRLRPAEQIVVGVGSSVRAEDLGLFSMQNWLKDYRAPPEPGVLPTPENPGSPLDADLIETIMEAVRDGLHSMVSPTLDLRLVHAVQHPLDNPVGSLDARRAVGDTSALLVHDSSPLLGLNIASTGQIELIARWEELIDAADPQQVAVTVQISRIDIASRSLPTLVHEFGDTRHRAITYTLTALSRFGDYFEPGTDIRSKPLTQVVQVPSSARPPEPVVLSVTPTFRWIGTELPEGWTEVERTRVGGGFRIELGRPWHVSGAGERLAVLLDGGATPAKYRSTVRRDPVFATASPSIDPAPSAFEGAIDPEQMERLAETGDQVLVVPYAPKFAGEGDLPAHWCVDVFLPAVAETSYWPFISLAVARYQPHSVEGQALSRVVRCEPVQLVPRRTLRVIRSGTQVTWDLSGPSQEFAENFDLAEQPGAQASRVTAHLERLPAGTGRTDVTAARADLGVGWHRVDESLAPSFELPAGDEPLRLVVREVQRYFRSLDADAPGEELNERLTFLDVVPLR